MSDPAAVALADQLSAEVMDRAMRMAKAEVAQGGANPLSDVDADLVELGIAAGFAVTLLALSERGWIRGSAS